MTILKSIEQPLPGEWVIGVQPEIRREVEVRWQRRLNFYTTRALSDRALAIEQQERAGRLTTQGQIYSPGVVEGLEVGLEPSASTVSQLSIGAGMGLSASGEIVVLPTAQAIPVQELRVYAPAELLRPGVPFSSAQVAVGGGFFTGASSLNVNFGDTLFAYVYLDPAQPPEELEITWILTDTRIRRAYWRKPDRRISNSFAAHRYRGDLPPAGQWVRLEVPASDLELGDVPIYGLNLSGGRVAWGPVGKAGESDTLWVNGDLPPGANPGSSSWNWQPAASPFPTAPLPFTESLDETEFTPSTDSTVRLLGGSLRQLIGSGAAARFPKAAVLVLQPVVAEEVGDLDPTDSCERDLQNDAFENWQTIDGCRPLLYLWDTEILGEIPAGDRWRNRLAYAIFSQEKGNDINQLLPWEQVGVPIALIGFDNDWKPLFADRYAVVRTGGKPKRRSQLVSNSGTPFLWQARIQQFAEQVAAIDLSAVSAAQLSQFFLFLPPVGLLPKTALDFEAQRSDFFPSSYSITALPIPLEQLDGVIQESASLVPFDLSNPDQVQVLVPVPQVWYEPEMLETEQENPVFQQAINQFQTLLLNELHRREIVRRRSERIIQGITGQRSEQPAPQIDRFRRLILQNPPPASPILQMSAAADLHQLAFTNAATPLIVNPGDRLIAYVYLDANSLPQQIMVQWWAKPAALGDTSSPTFEHRAYWGADLINQGTANTASRFRVGNVPGAGWTRLEVPAASVGLENYAVTGMAFSLVGGGASWAYIGKATQNRDLVWFSDGLPAAAVPTSVNDRWTWVDTDAQLADREAAYQTRILNNISVVEPLESLKNQLLQQRLITDTELPELDKRGLRGFIDFLGDRISKANNKIEFGYARLRSDIYRINQFLTGNDIATRLGPKTSVAGTMNIAKANDIVRGKVFTFVDEAVKTVPNNIRLARLYDRQFQYLGEQTQIPFEQLNQFKQDLAVKEGIDLSVLSGGQIPGGQIPGGQIPGGQIPGGQIPGGQIPGGQIPGVVQLPGGIIDAQIPGGIISGALTPELLQGIPIGRAAESPTFRAASQSFTADAFAAAATSPPKASEFSVRLQDSKAIEARNFAVVSKYDILKGLTELEGFGDIDVPALDATKKLQDINSGILEGILKNDYDSVPKDTDEGGFFAASIAALDNLSLTLDFVGDRIKKYQQAIALCQQTLSKLEDLALTIARRLTQIQDQLTETEQDLSVARALLQEEQARVQQINQRRCSILDEYVTFLAFCRPRLGDRLVNVASRPLDPAYLSVEDGLPACSLRQVKAPDDLRRLFDMLRDAPVKWFTSIPPILNGLDRLDILYTTIEVAKQRAMLQYAVTAPKTTVSPGFLSEPLNQVFTAQQQTIAQYRTQAAQLDLSVFTGRPWKESRDRAKDVLSLGDLLDAKHGRSAVVQQTAQLLENIASVATCLYGQFGQVSPDLRLEWVERYSQYDAPIDLRVLANLSRWNEVDRLIRREMQNQVNWLYQQIDTQQSDALNWMNNLVRVCLLLASHAPVNRLIAGQLAEATTVRPGGQVKITIDPNTVRVGMQVLLYQGINVVAQAVVEDLAVNQVAARVTKSTASSILLAQGTQVQFTDLQVLNSQARNLQF
ncbi:hypothetical protein [Leptolyngbya ohadii]|uniref:hypothetical protein n=1 Tax=Leptolyngbya ohadii TaxID=1962290 RepID=UPI000B59E40C|nr:hypothetical protein [Leptolyngbya ohadii]